ncbi:hypothetical protein N431DRAFT_470897 [Stipitochalara longipes BDJ]|nr:hypothetical protein N431DRAFT_470897 [Stipitochalara longipes BDJ]
MSSQDQTPYLESSTTEPSNPEPSARSIIRSMKRPSDGAFHMSLGDDGVMRCFGAYPEFPLYDAVGFSPAQIKWILDLSPFSQEAEDKFRGVDGRTVTGHEALFNPPASLRPPVITEEEAKEIMKETERKNREMKERIERERGEGVDVDAKYACGRLQSDHDLRPKEDV